MNIALFVIREFHNLKSPALVQIAGVPSIVIVALALFPACKTKDVVQPPPSGAYQYAAYDSTGALIVRGWLSLEQADGGRVSGEWQFSAVPGTRDFGPQTGEGRLEGAFQDSLLVVNLNPSYVDNNVLLLGRKTETVFTGRWQWISFIGLTNRGSFVATAY